MSDHLHIDIQVEIYDQWQMAYDERGNLLKETIGDAVAAKVREFGFKPNQFFITGSVY